MDNDVYAYVMLKSNYSETFQVFLSKTKIDTKSVIDLMKVNKCDIGCDLYFVKDVSDYKTWIPIEFYSGLLTTIEKQHQN